MLTLNIYEATKAFPIDERFGLTSQIRRSSASIPTNIAEGCGRSNNGDFQRFLETAMGSASEAEYQLLLARDLGYLDDDKFKKLDSAIAEIQRMLASLIRKVTAERRR